MELCFHFSVHTPRNGIVWLYGNSSFNLLRDGQAIFHSSCTVLHTCPPTPQQCKDSNFSTSLPTACYFVFLIIAILVGVMRYLFLVLICITLTSNDVENLFLCFLAICLYPLEKYQLTSLTYFSIGFLSFYCWVVRVKKKLIRIQFPHQIYEL